MAEEHPTQGGDAMHTRYVVKLDKDERKDLSQLVKKEKVAVKNRTHAQVLLLALADGGQHGPAWKDEAIAEACRVTVRTVENIRKRLVLEGLDSALNRKPQVCLSRQPPCLPVCLPCDSIQMAAKGVLRSDEFHRNERTVTC
jgi:hypothetical protein